MKRLERVILTVFIIYHLTAVVLFANPESLIARRVENFFRPYADTLGLNTPWRFFAPNPGKSRTLEIEMSRDGEFVDLHFWPPRSRKGYFTENYNRRFYHSVMTTATPERLEAFLIPWLCRRFPKANTFSVRAVLVDIPHIEKARLKDQEFSEMGENLEYPAQEYTCATGEGS